MRRRLRDVDESASFSGTRSASVILKSTILKDNSEIEPKYPPILRKLKETLYTVNKMKLQSDILTLRKMEGKDLMKLWDKKALDQSKRDRTMKELHSLVDPDSKKQAHLNYMLEGASVDVFLKPYTKEFMDMISFEHKEGIKSAIDTLDINRWTNLMTQRTGLFERIFNDCMVKKLTVDPPYYDVVIMIARELSSIFIDSQRFLNELVSKMYKNINSSIETSKYDNILADCFQIINLMNNPLMSFSLETIEKNKATLRNHMDYLQRNSFIPSNIAKVKAIISFEDDMKRFNKLYCEMKLKHEIAIKENEKYQKHIQDLREQILEDKKLFEKRSEDLREEMDRRLLQLEPKLDTVSLLFHQTELKKVQSEREALSKELEALKLECNTLTEDSKQLKHIKKLQLQNKVNKETQTLTASEPIKYQGESRIDKFLSTPTDIDLAKCILQDEHWALSVIDLILHDKFIKDMLDDQEKRRRSSLNAFLKEWFLTTFGLQPVAELFLGDFVKSLKKYGSQSMRLRTFCTLANFAEFSEGENEPQNLAQALALGINPEKINKMLIRRRFKASPVCCSIYLRTIYMIKSMINKCDFETFLPSLLIAGADSYETSKLTAVLKEILRIEKVSSDKVADIVAEFNSLVEKDLYLQLSERQLSQKQPSNIIKTSEEKVGQFSIRFDTFVDFVLEKLTDIYTDNIIKLFTKLRMMQDASNTAALNLDTFKAAIESQEIKVSQRWQELRFCEMLEKDIHHNPPLIQIYLKIIDAYYEMKQIDFDHEAKYLTLQEIQDKSIKTYDVQGSANVLFDTYKILQEATKIRTKLTGNLDYLLQNFERDLKGVSLFLQSVKDYNKISLIEKERLIKNLESNWGRFRKILIACYTN